MKTEIPVDAMKGAVSALNGILEKGKIKTVGRKKTDIIKDFADKVMEFLDAGKVKELPDVSIDFFNTYIASDDEGKPQEKKDKSEKNSKSTKSSKEKSPKSPKSVKEVTRESSIVHAMKSGGTKEEIVAASDSFYVEKGGSSNLSQSAKLFDRAVKYFLAYGALSIVDNKYKLK